MEIPGKSGYNDPAHSQLVGCGPHSPQSLGVGSDASSPPPFSGECYVKGVFGLLGPGNLGLAPGPPLQASRLPSRSPQASPHS